MTPLKKPVVLTIQALHFGYPDRALFTDFHADVPAGITLVSGGDGCGKSTLLRLMGGAFLPASGDLLINGISARTNPVNYQKQVAWLEPRTHAFDQLTAVEFFHLQRKHAGLDSTALTLLTEGLDLKAHQDKPLFQLSTGSKRKVWLVAALASNAAVTLLDEPFAALDAPSIRFVTAWLNNAAYKFSDRAWILGDYTAPADLPLASIIDLDR